MHSTLVRGRSRVTFAISIAATLLATSAASQVSLVKDINPGDIGSSSGHGAIALGSKIVFSADDGVHGQEPWVSDGTTAGTFMLAEILVGEDPPGPCGDASSPEAFIQIGGIAYFIATDHYDDTYFFCRKTVWATDGTSSGTAATSVLVKSWDPSSYAVMGGALYLRGWDPDYGEEIWKIDGGNQYMIRDAEPGTFGSLPLSFSTAVLDGIGERLFFVATTQADGQHPWISGGLPGNTALLKVINDTSGNSGAGEVVGFDGKGWFQADDGDTGSELWTTDGTAGGTQRFMDINDGAWSSNPFGFMTVGSLMFFGARYDNFEFHLWVTDGTIGNTRPVIDPETGLAPTSPLDFTPFGGKLYFTAETAAEGRELWVTDGTSGGTMIVNDIYPGSGSSDPEWLVVADGKLFFSAFTSDSYRELWVTNGTAAGTMLVEDIYPGGTYSAQHSSWPNQLVAAGGNLFFFADDGSLGSELRKLPLTDMVTTPDAPTGPNSGSIDTTLTYQSGGSVSLAGDDVQYRFDWDDGETSGWLPVGADSADHEWGQPATYTVTVEARAATQTGSVSKVSLGLDVVITDEELLTTPSVIGPSAGLEGETYQYTVGATSSKGHALEFMVSWGDGTSSDWMPIDTGTGQGTAAHAWAEMGLQNVFFYVQCIADGAGVYSSTQLYVDIGTETIDMPVLDGPTAGYSGVSYLFTVSGSSNAQHGLEYTVWWGDDSGEDIAWTPLPAGGSVELSHRWSEPGDSPVDVGIRCAVHTDYEIWMDPTHWVTVSTDPALVFADGFESGDLSQW